MEATFYLAAAVAVASTLMVIVERTAVHALLYLIVSLLAVAVVFYVLGAPFVAALEVIVYAGAIMVLFVFVLMMLNLSKAAAAHERRWLRPGMWIGPGVLAALLLAELIYMLASGSAGGMGAAVVEPKAVGIVLLGPYLLGVELASMLLLAGLVGAYHLGWRDQQDG
ncbi:MAG: NADH-quinone oxidoreductase subunit J [Gammaproteobacteria bacterium]